MFMICQYAIKRLVCCNGRSDLMDWGMFKDSIRVWPVHFKQKSMLIVLKYNLMRSFESLKKNINDAEIDLIKCVNMYWTYPIKRPVWLKSQYHTKGLLLIKGQESLVSDYFVNFVSVIPTIIFNFFPPYQFKILLCEYENEGQLLLLDSFSFLFDSANSNENPTLFMLLHCNSSLYSVYKNCIFLHN